MAQLVTADIYGVDSNLWASPYKRGFPTQGICVFPAPTGTYSMYGIVLNSVVKLLTEEGQPEYLTNKSVVQLATDSNL